MEVMVADVVKFRVKFGVKFSGGGRAAVAVGGCRDGGWCDALLRLSPSLLLSSPPHHLAVNLAITHEHNQRQLVKLP